MFLKKKKVKRNEKIKIEIERIKINKLMIMIMIVIMIMKINFKKMKIDSILMNMKNLFHIFQFIHVNHGQLQKILYLIDMEYKLIILDK